METRPSNEMNNFIENLVTSYETRLNQIESIFATSETITESSSNLLSHFNSTILELKKERESLNVQLREALAQKGSLRRKDYDRMMGEILSFLEQKEMEAEEQFCDYVTRQKTMASTLKAGLLNITDPHTEDSPEKIKQFQNELEQISKSQEQRKETVMNHFLTFQQIHSNVTNRLSDLLENREYIQPKDVKMVVKDLLRNTVV